MKNNSLSAFKNCRGLRFAKKAGVFANTANYNVALGVGLAECTAYCINVIIETKEDGEYFVVEDKKYKTVNGAYNKIVKRLSY